MGEAHEYTSICNGVHASGLRTMLEKSDEIFSTHYICGYKQGTSGQNKRKNGRCNLRFSQIIGC